MPKVGGHYRHYKGNEYKVLCVARSSENIEEQFVIYQDMSDDKKIWARPLGMFIEHVEIDGKSMPRFTPIG